MEFHEFESYEEYLKEQRRLTLRKAFRTRHRVFTVPEVVAAIKNDYPFLTVREGCCHGVRKGEEVDFFAESLGGHWIGTEIVKELCDDKKVICADFSEDREEWRQRFDVIYSNAYDHSPNPQVTAQVWVNSLAQTGRLYVEWTPWHEKLGQRGNRADCFAASFEEYSAIFAAAGAVIHNHLEIVSRSSGRTFKRLILVASRMAA
jgi:hypothetical protein